MGLENEDRQCFRAPVVEHCGGTLYFGGAKLIVTLLNQSATGFKLSTDDPRLIPEQIDALLDLNDGVQHSVEIRRVEREGEVQILGVRLLETRLSRPVISPELASARRRTMAKFCAAVALVAVSAFAIQAAPVGRQFEEWQWFSPAPSAERAAQPSKPASTPVRAALKLDRDRPFALENLIADDSADWLELQAAQRGVLRGLLDLCGGARNNRLPPAHVALLDFAAEGAMLQQLNSEQRNKLEQELEQPLTGSAVLRSVIERYSSRAGRRDLARQFGVLLVVSPKIAAEFGIPAEAAALVCRRVDEAFQPAAESRGANLDANSAERIVLAYSARVKQLEAECRELLTSTTANVPSLNGDVSAESGKQN